MPNAYSRAAKAQDDSNSIRLQKLLAQAGFGSRRKCEDMITEGRVEVDGELVTELGTRVDPHKQQVRVDGSRVRVNPNHVTLALNKPRKVAAEGINPFPQWAEVIKLLQEQDPMLYTYLKKSKGYFDGTRVLIDGGKTFRDFIRANKESQKLIKKLIAQVSGVAVPIGPYESKTVNRASANAEESLRKLEQLGLEVSIEDSERKKR